ncbi:MAG TPA: aminopeptidase P N-terminal domain-containing protein, partial [Pyrinomonadaceae bacterium]
MKSVHTTRVALIVFVLITAIATMASTLNLKAAAEKPLASVIKIAPAAPVFDDKERLGELAQRRNRVAQTIGPKSIMVLFSGEPRVYANDVSYPFRQENNLYYLTNLKQQNATLVLLPGNTQTPEILFLPKRNPAAETWTGHMYTPQEAQQLSGVKEIWDSSEFEPFMKALNSRQPYRAKAENIFLSELPASTTMTNGNGFEPLLDAVGKNEAFIYFLAPRTPNSKEYKREQVFAADLAQTASGFSLKNAWPIFTEMRLRKSAMELRLMQHAIDISIEAHERAWAAAADAKWEYEVDAV